MKHDHVKIPFALERNDRDRRGLPIPFIVFRDPDGTPHFTINDAAAMQLVVGDRLCALCGKPLKLGKMWFVGGPSAAFHENGLYIDPPSHEDCGRYAMQVCPFIAAQNYSKRIDDKTVDPTKFVDAHLVMDNAMDPARPQLFVFSRASSYELVDVGEAQKYLRPRRPWKDIEYWCKGERIQKCDAAALIVAQGEFLPEELKWWP